MRTISLGVAYHKYEGILSIDLFLAPKYTGAKPFFESVRSSGTKLRAAFNQGWMAIASCLLPGFRVGT